jgi:heat-inducible transcriptional repressor
MSQDVPIGKAHVSLAQLNDRSRDIFRQIVESYLATGEPVGSRNLARLITTPLSPASVRNVMSDLEQLGLIYAPHTSAGRLPTELGLALHRRAMDWRHLGGGSPGDGGRSPPPAADGGRVSEATAMLSGLTSAAGVVPTAKQNLRLGAYRVRAARSDRALVVLVARTGRSRTGR